MTDYEYLNKVKTSSIHFKDTKLVDFNDLNQEQKFEIFVSSFGHTTTLVNNEKVHPDKFDWFYKGNGNGIILNNSEIILPKYGISAGIEAEILTVHQLNQNLEPIYLGYTLGLDVSYKGLRTRNPSLINFSHLSQTVISSHFIEEDYPLKLDVNLSVKRDGITISSFDSQVGSEFMKNDLSSLFDYLFRNKEILSSPGMYFYTLTGASISTNKENIVLKSNDKLISTIPEKRLSLKNIFKND